MKTKSVAVKTMREHAYCMKPGCKGELEFTGQAYTQGMAPTKYNHKCRECGLITVLDDAYPRIVYKE